MTRSTVTAAGPDRRDVMIQHRSQYTAGAPTGSPESRT
jgi:hypothetical protein